MHSCVGSNAVRSFDKLPANMYSEDHNYFVPIAHTGAVGEYMPHMLVAQRSRRCSRVDQQGHRS